MTRPTSARPRAAPPPTGGGEDGALRRKSSARPANLGLFPGAPGVLPVPKRKAMGSIHGDGRDHKALGSATFRSLLERDMRTLLGANPAVVHYAVEPHELLYFIPDGRGGHVGHAYVPDVVCRYRSGEVVVIDAKALYFTSLPGWTRREPHIREAYALDHGVPFATLGENVLRAEPRLSNCEIMERHRYIVPDAEATMATRAALRALDVPATVGDVVRRAALANLPGQCRAFTAMMNLALAGEAALDLGVPFGPGTLVFEGDAA